MMTTTERLSDRQTRADALEQAGGLTPPRSEDIEEGDIEEGAMEPLELGFHAFPVECFPGPVCEYVRSQARELDCDESAVALPVLAALAASIGSTRRIRLKRDWTEPAGLSPKALTLQKRNESSSSPCRSSCWVSRANSGCVGVRKASLRCRTGGFALSR